MSNQAKAGSKRDETVLQICRLFRESGLPLEEQIRALGIVRTLIVRPAPIDAVELGQKLDDWRDARRPLNRPKDQTKKEKK